MYKIAVIADDFTSVTDCTISFACKGMSTAALTNVPETEYPESEVIGLNTESRTLLPEEAYYWNQKAALQLKSQKCEVIYKSVDSTLRGNLGAEIDGVMDGYGYNLAFVAPAFPHYGRTTVKGTHYLNGCLLEESPIAKDPTCPAKESVIIDILGKQSKRKMANLGLEFLRGSKSYFVDYVNSLKSEGVEIIVADAETEEVYYYTLASQAGVPLLIRIPEQALIPQNQFKDMESTVFNEESVLNWAATNTVGAGLSEGIKPDEQYSGVKSVTVKAPIGTWKDGKLQNDGGMFQDTYYTVYKHNATTNQDILMITSQNGSYKDERWTTGKEFNKFYYMLIAHPIPSRFNSMTEAEIAEKAKDENLLFTLYVELNDGRVQLLEYYQISSEYVMMRNTMGETVNGAIVMGETNTVFDTTRGQVIDYLQDSLIKLITGVKIET